MMNAEEIIITDNEFLRQFETTINQQLSTIEYAQQERKIFLTKVFMPEALKEAGYMDIFIEAVLEEIKDRNTRVMPTSPDVAKFMRKNRRKYKDLLPVGINI
jgi:hypothetical protein